MTDKYGAAHRQLVQDTNDGKVATPPKKVTTSVASGGSGHKVIGDDSKSALYQGLLGVGQEILSTVKARQDELDFAEGYNKGLDEGYAENERSPLRDMLFGPSATLRGAQKRIIDNDSRMWLNARMTSLEDDIKTMDEDEYQVELTEQLQKTLEQHDDPEIIAQLSQSAAKNFQTLARNHAQQRQIWIDASNEQAVVDNMNGGILQLRAAQKHGDVQSQLQAQEDAEAMFDQPLDMNHEVWLKAVNRTIVETLGRGEVLAYDLAEDQGLIAAMSQKDRAKLQSAYAIYDHKNGRKFHVAQQSLTSRIDNGLATDAELVAFKQEYPEQGDNLNSIREYKDKVDAELAEIARQKALTIDELMDGDVKFNSREPAERRDAVTSTFNSIADENLAQIRQKNFEKGTFTGDMEAPFTAQQRFEYMLENPMPFAQVWAKHPDVKTPMIQNLVTNIISDFRNENLDPEVGVPAMVKKVNALKQFQMLDGGNFHNQFRSAKDAQDFSVYTYMVDAGFDPINAVRELRLVSDMPEIELAEYADALDEGMEDLADDFLGQSPESQGWLGLYNKTPDNEQAFNSELKSRLAEALTIYKGDMSKALPAASAAIRRNGLVANGQFIPNGRALDIKGGSLEDYIRGLNADDAMRTQITNSGNGFAPDVDYTTLELSANPFNKKAVLMHGRHETTGQPITISLNLPQHGSHFSTYGFNSFTGYNPNIADTEERKAVFLRNNKLLSTYKTIGKAIDQAVK